MNSTKSQMITINYPMQNIYRRNIAEKYIKYIFMVT